MSVPQQRSTRTLSKCPWVNDWPHRNTGPPPPLCLQLYELGHIIYRLWALEVFIFKIKGSNSISNKTNWLSRSSHSAQFGLQNCPQPNGLGTHSNPLVGADASVISKASNCTFIVSWHSTSFLKSFWSLRILQINIRGQRTDTGQR